MSDETPETALKRAQTDLAREQSLLAKAQAEQAKRHSELDGFRALLTPTGGVILVAAIGLIGTAVGKWADMKATRLEQETSLILKASEIPSELSAEDQTKQRAKNLLWFAKTGYLQLDGARIARLEQDAGIEAGEDVGAPVIASQVSAQPLAPSADIIAMGTRREGGPLVPKKVGKEVIIGSHSLTPEELRTGKMAIGGQSVSFRDGITSDQANQITADRMEAMWPQIRPLITVELSQKQREALSFFAGDVGPSKFKKSSVLAAVNERRFDDVPAELLKYGDLNGRPQPAIMKRRREEGAIWQSGTSK